MAVLLETTRGDIVIDLFHEECPVTCKNFVKLCKIKYFNNCLFHDVQRNFIVQSGDPTGTGKGGMSIYGMLYGDQARFFEDEVKPMLRHKAKGMVGMASPVPHANASQFYITTGEDLHSLDTKHTIFGQVGEGLDVLDKINEAFLDDSGRPMQNIRIRHTIILEDPFPDPPELEALIPPASPEPQFEQGDRLEDDWVPVEDTRDVEEIEDETRKADAHNRAVVLEMIGDLPEADAKPPSNVLFICKLNPVTTEEDLEIIFSRFGRVTDCDIIRDFKTGDSLCYGFIGFDAEAQCEEAYFKMNNVLIDDRRIKVDFSQSVSHLWKQFKKGGRKGDMSMMKEADTHQRGAGADRLEFKGTHAMGGRGGPPGGGQHQLMLDDEEEEEPIRGPRGPPAGGSGGAPHRQGPPPAGPRKEYGGGGGGGRERGAPDGRDRDGRGGKGQGGRDGYGEDGRDGRGGRREEAGAARQPDGDRGGDRGGDRSGARQQGHDQGRDRDGDRGGRDDRGDRGRDSGRGGGRHDVREREPEGRQRERDGERARDREPEGGRQRERDGGREKEGDGRRRDKSRDRERGGGGGKQRERSRERERSRDREGGRERDRSRETERDGGSKRRDR